MKVVSWNCNGALRNKYHTIDRLDADLLIVQECEDPERSTKAYREWASQYLWHGNDKNKGVGVFLRSESKLKRLDWDDDGLQLFLPCTVGNRFVLLAVWTKHANSPNFRYIGQLWKYLQIHKDRLAPEEFLVCGDLNSNKCWDEWDRWWNHSDVVRELDEIGARSIYHEHFQESQGEESHPTLFHRRDPTKPYHVDYAFATKSLYDGGLIQVGDKDDWLEYSDHMPLTFSITQ